MIHTSYIANLALPGKRDDELSYSFSERSTPVSEHTAVFGLFHAQSTQEIYQIFIKETVKSYLDFFHRARPEISEDEIDTKTDGDDFLFEHSLQYVNEHVSKSLAEYQERANRTMGLEMRKLHYIIGALIGKTLYLTVRGKLVRAFLLYPAQSGNPSLPYALMDITEQETTDDQANGFFSSVISGSVSIPQCKLVVCNNTFLDYVSSDQLKHALTNQPSNSLANYFTRHLSRASARSDFAALFIDPWYDDAQSLAQSPLPKEMRTSHSSIESMLERQKGTTRVLTPGFGRVSKALLGSIMVSITTLVRRIPKNATVPSIIRSVRIPKLSISPHQLKHSAAQNIRATRKGFAKAYQFGQHQLIPSIVTISRNILQFLRVRVWDAFQSLQPNSKALLIVSILFIILFLQSLIAIQFKRNHENIITTQQEKLTEAEQKLNLAEASIIYESDEKTKALLNEAEEILKTIRTLPDLEKQIASLKEKQQTLLKKLSRTIEVSAPALLADLSNQIPSVGTLRFVGETNPLIVANADGLYRIDTKAGNAQQINTQSKLPAITCAAALSTEMMYVCGAENRMFSYRLPTDTLSAIPYADSGQSFGEIAIFNKRLYVFDASRGVLTRHNKSGEGFSSGVSWIKDGSSVADAKGFAIDGNVYFLMPDSSIAIYNTGKRIKTVPLPSLQPPVQSLSRLKASEGTNLLYLVDSAERRILVMDSRTSSFVLAVTSPVFQDSIQDILVTKSDLYVLSNGKLARIPLDQIKL